MILQNLFKRHPVLAMGLSLALLPCITKAQTSDGTVDMNWSGYPTSQTYPVEIYENGGTANGGLQEGAAYSTAVVQDFSDPSSSVASLPTSLTLFCIELGQDNVESSNLYQILDSNSLSYADATDILPSVSDPTGSPNATIPTGQTYESDAGISYTTGIGSTTATNLMKLFGYAFGTGGALANGYNLAGVSMANQAAFQIAIWQLAYNGSGYIPAGGGLNSTPVNTITPTGFSVTGIDSTVANEANVLLNAIYTNNGGLGISEMDLAVLNSGTYQDFLLPESSLTAIPEPSTYAAILGAAALGFIVVRRRLRLA